MQQWKIRILSGVHAGVEITLPNGILVLGSDDFTADLVLTDSDIKAIHLVLECDGETVLLRDCEDVSINSESVSIDASGIELFKKTLVSVGCLTFALGYPEDDLAIDIATELENNQAALVNHQPLSGWKVILIIGLMFSLIPSIIFASFWHGQIKDNDNNSLTEAELIVLVRNILSELKLDEVRVKWNATAKQTVLEGYVEGRTQKLRLQGKMDVLGINYKSDIRTMEEIRRSARFILRNLGYHHVKVDNGEETGTLLLTGYIDDATRWSQVEQVLERDVKGLVAWKVDLQRAGAYMDTLKVLLEKAELLRKVQLITSGDSIEVHGELDDIEITSFYAVVRDFREKYGKKPYLVLKSIPKESKGTNIDFPFRSVNFGRVPYITLTDNIRYMVGARTPQGYRISSVTTAGIELVKGGRVITIEIGDEGGNTNDKS